MRSLLYTLSIAAVVAMAYWAYGEGYETRQTEREVARLERAVGARHQELSMLRAEWAYLNRPDRLHELAEMNFETLGLIPLAPDHFALVEQVGYAPPPPPELPPVVYDPDVVLGEMVDDVVVMTHRTGLDTSARLIAPPRLSDDGEQLP